MEDSVKILGKKISRVCHKKDDWLCVEGWRRWMTSDSIFKQKIKTDSNGMESTGGS